MSRILLFCICLNATALCTFAQAPGEGNNKTVQTVSRIKGKILNEIGEPLPGAYIQIVGTMMGTVSRDDGRFEINVGNLNAPRLLVSFNGYETVEVDANKIDNELSITLTPTTTLKDEVVVSASRQSEKITQSPVTIEKLDMQSLRESSSPNLYDALANLKGVDIAATSITMKSINTRGFNSPFNSRFVQRIDGMDMQTPGLNVPIGALNGSTDLDVESVELVPGASSALYGPNAFNGMLNVNTKSPFQYPGLSAMVRGSFNHLDRVDAKPSLFSEMALRYAHVINDKVAFKFNLAYLGGQDWHATDYRDVADYSGTVNLRSFFPGRGNPGYDGLNMYGDEVSNVFDSTTFAGSPIIPIRQPTRIARTGYKESDLFDYDTYSFRADGGVFFRLGHAVELSLNSRFARGSSMIQADNRIALQDFTVQSHKIELKGNRFFIRSYGSLESAGKSFDTRFAAINVNRRWKSDENWFAQYIMAYSGVFNLFNTLAGLGMQPITPSNDLEARAFADGDNSALANNLILRGLLGNEVERLRGDARLLPGTAEFQNALADVKNTTNFDKGAKFVDNTGMLHTEGQYDFTGQIKPVDILVGGNVRAFALDSDGLVFGDTAGTIWATEYGAYMQLSKKVWHDRLKLIGSGRIDKAKSFDLRFSPRVAAVLTVGNHNFRASYQTGFKYPDLRHRYLNFSVSTFQVIGGFEEAFRHYGLVLDSPEGNRISNAYSLNSVQNFLRSSDSTVLVHQNIDPIRPEFVQNFEIGYKGMPFGEKIPLMLDVCYYHNRYKDFIGMISFVGPAKKDVNTPNAPLTAQDIQTKNPDGSNNYTQFRRYANATENIHTHGFALGALWWFSPKLTLGANYSMNRLVGALGSDFNTEFNTPTHKAGASIAARELWKHFGFAVNYRWNDAFNYQYSFASGPIPAYQLVDANISYHLPKYNSTLKLGGTNILNNRHIEVFGGPTIGGMLYLQVTYDSFLN